MGERTIEALSRATNKLTVAYSKGATVYPRVANDYIETPPYHEHPHPPLSRFDEYATSLRLSEYPLSKATLPIELSNVGISTPATLMGQLKIIDQYFTADLKLRESRSQDFSQKLNAFHEHLEQDYAKYGDDIVGRDDLPDVNLIAKDGVVAKKETNLTLFKIKLSPSPPREKKKKDNPPKKVRDSVENYPEEVKKRAVRVNSAEEAIRLYKKKRAILMRIEKQKELMIQKALRMKG